MLKKEIMERAMNTDPAQVGHFLESGYMAPRIKPVDPSFKVVGPAYTVRCSGMDNSIIYYAMSQAPAGSVLVIDRMGNDRVACVGEMSVMNAQTYGLAGIVVDGAVTDSPQIKELGMPVFAAATAAVACSLKYTEGEIQVPVNCGGVVVSPGDIIFGNADGVVVCREEEFEKWLEAAEGADRNEVKWRAHFRKGGHLDELYPIKEKVEERLASKK